MKLATFNAGRVGRLDGDGDGDDAKHIGVLRNHLVPWAAAHDTPPCTPTCTPPPTDPGLRMRFGTQDQRFVLPAGRMR